MHSLCDQQEMSVTSKAPSRTSAYMKAEAEKLTWLNKYWVLQWGRRTVNTTILDTVALFMLSGKTPQYRPFSAFNSHYSNSELLHPVDLWSRVPRFTLADLVVSLSLSLMKPTQSESNFMIGIIRGSVKSPAGGVVGPTAGIALNLGLRSCSWCTGPSFTSLKVNT